MKQMKCFVTRYNNLDGLIKGQQNICLNFPPVMKMKAITEFS